MYVIKLLCEYFNFLIPYMNRFQVPQWVKSVFDTFPLTTYEATPLGDQSDIEKSRFYFISDNPQKPPDHTFILGVDGVIGVNQKIIPSTPVALAHSLILCYKNGLKLPRENSNQKTSPHSILSLSYLAASNNELPIIIETNERTQVRNIIPKKGLLTSIVTNNNFEADIKAKLINNMVDSYIQDLWILALICEPKARSEYERIFNWNSGAKKSENMTFLHTLAVQGEIPEWNDFRTRNPNLFSSKTWNALANQEALQNVYEDKLKQFDQEFSLLIEYATGHDPLTKIIRFKLAALAILTAELLPDTHLANILQSNQDFLAQCYTIIDEY